MSSDIISLLRITYKETMQDLKWAAIAIPAAPGVFVQLGNYCPDEHKCHCDKLVDCVRGGEREISTSFQVLTL